MTNDLHQTFQENRKRYQADFDRLNNDYQLFSMGRIVLFLSTIGSAGYLFYIRELTIAAIAASVGILIFGLIVNHHKNIAFRRKQAELLIEINQEEESRLQPILSGFDMGNDFVDEHHNYTSDMDVFGSNSLFQLLNRTKLPAGRRRLANWLRDPASQEDVLKRQDAIQELNIETEWTQNFQAFSRHKEDPKIEDKFKAFREWMNLEPIQGLRTKFILGIMVTAINLIIVGLVMTAVMNYKFLLLSTMLGLGLVGSLQAPIRNATDASEAGFKILSSYQLLIRWMLDKSWTSSLIKEQLDFLSQPKSAIVEINQLKQSLDALNSRSNIIYWIFNSLFVIDIHMVIKVEKWKRDNASHFDDWISAISEMEALTGIASFAFSNPDYAVPQIEGNEFKLEAKDLAHPLIKADKRVGNDFVLNGEGTIGVITGSNMSGKSTFLRTVGINLVLAQTGAPVCAYSFRFTPTRVFTSMRTSDNLEESVSSFYAELKRIERLLSLVKEDIPIFFMLDEILKGTNTKDRHLGAQSLIKQLGKEKCTGLISTHDIALGEMSKGTKSITNLHFSSEIKDHELLFDYKLKPGVCESFNASELMAKIGIKLDK